MCGVFEAMVRSQRRRRLNGLRIQCVLRKREALTQTFQKILWVRVGANGNGRCFRWRMPVAREPAATTSCRAAGSKRQGSVLGRVQVFGELVLHGGFARKLHQQIRGDLDWIVMKALEKDRTRRYETASGFAADVQRFLCDDGLIQIRSCRPLLRCYELSARRQTR